MKKSKKVQSVSWLQAAGCISWQCYCSPITVSSTHHADDHHPLGIPPLMLLHLIKPFPLQITVQLVWGRVNTVTKASRTPRPTFLGPEEEEDWGVGRCWNLRAVQTSSSTKTLPWPRASRRPTQGLEELSTK